MILTCPQCTTRYQADGSKFPAAGRSVRCAKCGHVWHQIGPQPEPDPDAEIEVHEPSPADVSAPPQSVADMSPSRHTSVLDEPPSVVSAPRVAAFAPSATVDSDFAADDAPVVRARSGTPWAGRIAVLGGWAMLVGLVLVIGWAAVSFRDNIATWLPQTSSLYSAAGLPVSARGIDFADVNRQLESEDGQQVLAVTGRIVNRSNHELTVPLVRVALYDGDRHELYHWTFVPGVSTLKPGQSSKFRTRLSSPPVGTRDIEVRFAKAGE
jgi:predicted Zn finger-like uncharacterized protein